MVSEPSCGLSTVLTPVTCLILQGVKSIRIGDSNLKLDRANYFVASLEVPASGEILDVSPDKPYVALGLTLDRIALADLIAELPPSMLNLSDLPPEGPSFSMSAVTEDLRSAWAGLLALLDRPDDIAMLAPARKREILYRLLQGPLGGHLHQIAQQDSRLSKIDSAVRWIIRHYDQTVRTTDLAKIAGMSLATFHRHFKAATAMSPIQYQKTLRLNNARIHLAAGVAVSEAAYAVGYESASQFSREYRRAFGVPPSLDITQMEERLLAAI